MHLVWLDLPMQTFAVDFLSKKLKPFWAAPLKAHGTESENQIGFLTLNYKASRERIPPWLQIQPGSVGCRPPHSELPPLWIIDGVAATLQQGQGQTALAVKNPSVPSRLFSPGVLCQEVIFGVSKDCVALAASGEETWHRRQNHESAHSSEVPHEYLPQCFQAICSLLVHRLTRFGGQQC